MAGRQVAFRANVRPAAPRQGIDSHAVTGWRLNELA